MMTTETPENLDSVSDWPYPIKYGEGTEIVTDVLILGGGVAGCHAALNATKQGVKVAIVDKGAVIRSGCGECRCGSLAPRLYQPCKQA